MYLCPGCKLIQRCAHAQFLVIQIQRNSAVNSVDVSKESYWSLSNLFGKVQSE